MQSGDFNIKQKTSALNIRANQFVHLSYWWQKNSQRYIWERISCKNLWIPTLYVESCYCIRFENTGSISLRLSMVLSLSFSCSDLIRYRHSERWDRVRKILGLELGGIHLTVAFRLYDRLGFCLLIYVSARFFQKQANENDISILTSFLICLSSFNQ